MYEELKFKKELFLPFIFALQDSTLETNLKDHNIYAKIVFIDRSLNLIKNFKIKHIGIQVIVRDILTNIICAARLGLYGCFVDASALLRISLENLCIADYVIDKDKYKTLTEGLSRGLQKVKLDYKSIMTDLNAKKFHQQLSDAVSHSTKTRLLLAGVYTMGQDCMGASKNKTKIKLQLQAVCQLCLFATRVILEYVKKHDIGNKDYIEAQANLEKRYEEVEDFGQKDIVK